MKTYRYQIVPAHGMYGSGDWPGPVTRSNQGLMVVEEMALRMTRDYQRRMAHYGGSSGGYRVVGGGETWTFGHDLDCIPDATV